VEGFTNKKRGWFQMSAGIPYNLNDDTSNVAKLITGRKLTIKVKTGKKQDGSDQNDICGVHPYTWVDPDTVQDEKLELDGDFL